MPLRHAIHAATRTALTAALTAHISLVVAGCALREAADPSRASASGVVSARTSAAAPQESGAAATASEQTTQIEWPTRDPEEADRKIWMQPGVQQVFVSGIEPLGRRVQTYVWSAPVRVATREKAGVGLVCEIERLDRDRFSKDPRGFMFFSSATPVTIADRSQGPPPPSMWSMDHTPMDGIIYRMYPPLPGVRLHGIVVSLRPLSGATYVRSVLNELRARGWLVLESSVSFGLEGVGNVRTARGDEDLDAIAREIAALVDRRMAEVAYGAEAMLEIAQREYPELRGAPVAVVGFSAGAIGSPTTVARLGDRVKAAVLVGGGVDVMRISQTSVLSDFGLSIEINGKAPDDEQIERLSRAYLAASKLDPYHTAPAMRGMPVLMLHAADDRIVPANTGKRLYELTGRPERWTFQLGHELLFWRLSAYDSEIADWVDRNALPRTEPGVATIAPPPNAAAADRR